MIRRVWLAALVTLGLGAGTWAYEAWPAWYGQDVTLQGLLLAKDPRTGRASIEFPAAKVRIEAPGIAAYDSPVPSRLVKQIDAVWPPGEDAVQSARLLQRREAAAPETEAAYVPVSISTAPVSGAINLRARVLLAEPTGRIDLSVGPPLVSVPPGLDESAFVTARLRVLPSGRHTLVRITQ
jgi:hypothetical protein